jgi:hypothetical protein
MSRKTRAVMIGVGAGALLGAAFAWIASQGAEDAAAEGGGDGVTDAIAALGPMDYFQLGISILTLARQFGAMLQRM